MSTLLVVNELNAELRTAVQTMAAARREIESLRSRNLALRDVLLRMVKAHRDLNDDTEGRYPELDCGCIECTSGATPDRYNTGLCAYHTALDVLKREVTPS